MLSWFKKKPSEENYEQVLASLELSIQKRQTQLSEIRLRERRATLLVTMWAFSIWVGYVALWWMGIIGQRGRGGKSVLWGLPVFVGPITAIFIRRIVQFWYTRKGNAEEKTLKELLVTQRNKIEEIKKKTNYYSTKSLLDRYDEGTKKSNVPSTPNVQRRVLNQTPQPRTPIKPQVMTNGAQAGQIPLMQQQNNTPVAPFSPVIGQLPTPKKQWYDKLADALLGDETASTGVSAVSRYALICERCFTHNGLVKEDQWEDAQYLCPKCGHFNKSIRARKALQGAGSPITPSKPTSTSSVPIPTSTVTTSHASPAARSAVVSSDPPTQDTPSSATSALTPNNTTMKRRPEKSPLSESTVLVEKSDAEEMDIDS